MNTPNEDERSVDDDALPVASPHITKEERITLAEPIPGLLSWLRGVFFRLDPPGEQIALSSFRWTRGGVVIGGLTLVLAGVTLWSDLIHPKTATPLYQTVSVTS